MSQNREALQDVPVSQGARPKGKGFAMDVLLYYVYYVLCIIVLFAMDVSYVLCHEFLFLVL